MRRIFDHRHESPKAMELVASSKMHREGGVLSAQIAVFQRPAQAITRLAGCDARQRKSQLLQSRVGSRFSLYIVIAGDRGLAGGYNANLFKLAAAEMQGKQAQVITIGKKVAEHCRRR